MLDIRLIRENPDLIKQRLANRGGDHASLVDQVLEIDTQRRSAETERQKLQSEINDLKRQIDGNRIEFGDRAIQLYRAGQIQSPTLGELLPAKLVSPL